MTDALSVHSAEITTATVTIKTVTINDRKLTLTTFRQIPHVAPGKRVRAWGWVNHHPDNCQPSRDRAFYDGRLQDHTHILGEDEDGQLVRWESYTFTQEDAERLGQVYIST